MDTTPPNNAPINGAEQAVANINQRRSAIIQNIIISIKCSIDAHLPIFEELYNNETTWSDADIYKFCDGVNKLPPGTNSGMSDVQLGLHFEAGVYMLSSRDGMQYLSEKRLSTKSFCAAYLHPAVRCAWQLCCRSYESSSTTTRIIRIEATSINILLGFPDNRRDFSTVPSNLPRSFGELYERIRDLIQFLLSITREKQSQIVRPTIDNVKQFMVSCPFSHQQCNAHQHTY
jgi:uncharacterized protein YcgL (UPF0745 family)